MNLPTVVDRDEWVRARQEFLTKEKALTRARDELNAQRRGLPVVRLDQDYVFDTMAGPRTLLELFDGRRQLIVYHFMILGAKGEFCRSCSFWVDSIGDLSHMHARDTSLVVDCPVPLARALPFRERMGWHVPWVSSEGTSFYKDLHVPLDDGPPKQPGISAFLRDGDTVYHSYSTHMRGSDLLNATYNYLDLTPLGRQEDGLGFVQEWVNYHDSYTS
jgi:predicted dithiol-disulfide oxidoreductase (DUF899 family)